MMTTQRAAGAFAVGATLLAISSCALAVPIGGLDLPAGPNFSVSQSYQNVPIHFGETLRGYGKVDSINSIPVSKLCSGCELTYVFGGYIVSSVSAGEIRYTSGFTKYYLGFGADRDFTTHNAGGSVGDFVEAASGTLFMSLRGHAVDAAGNTLIGTGVGIGTTSPTGFQTGLHSVDTAAGGIANAFYNTNSIPALFGGPADLQSGSSFSALNPTYPGECPGGAACGHGSTHATGAISGNAAGAAGTAAERMVLLLALIGGLSIPDGPIFSVSQNYQNSPTAIGDTLSGYGKVDSINSIPIESLCADCELTYAFGGYTVSSLSSGEIRYSGGFTRYYLGFGTDNDFTTENAGGSGGDLVEATNGTLFLSLMGHAVDAAGNTLIGTGVGIGTTSPTGFQTGLADIDVVTGGIANAFFDSDAILALFGGPADFQTGASFTALNPLYRDECPGGRACLRGSADLNAAVVTTGVPEPSTVLLITITLGGWSLARRRRFSR